MLPVHKQSFSCIFFSLILGRLMLKRNWRPMKCQDVNFTRVHLFYLMLQLKYFPSLGTSQQSFFSLLHVVWLLDFYLAVFCFCWIKVSCILCDLMLGSDCSISWEAALVYRLQVVDC